ncbi:MAG: PASTA domain-containing protein [Myxococcales bacterium FL481]|nr:MAG: PASTA domain-containing protein [Myxococcales bacterium FL481]
MLFAPACDIRYDVDSCRCGRLMVDTLKVILISLVISTVSVFALGPAMLKWHGLLPRSDASAVTSPTASSVPATAREMSTPNIEGLSVRAARDRWSREGIMVIEEGERVDAKVKPGTILEQIPTGGAPLRQKEIHVIVAKSPEMVTVPNVVGQPLDRARNSLLSAGFEVPPAALERSDKPAGSVIRQNPNANAKSPKGSIARLVVSEQLREVPKVVGKRLPKARQALKDAGFEVGEITRREHPEISGGRVLRQSPPAEAQHVVGGAVDLVVVAPD